MENNNFYQSNNNSSSTAYSTSALILHNQILQHQQQVQQFNQQNDYNLQSNNMSREVMTKFLENPSFFSLSILHAVVAQKSYGNEKRFFCPPPSIHIGGAAWDKKCQDIVDNLMTLNNNKTMISVGGGACVTNDNTQEESVQLLAFMGIGGSKNDMESIQLNLPKMKDYATAKILYISDSDKRRYFSLNLSLMFSNGLTVGNFESKRIEVISKPSKKKQTLKNTDLCISSGSKIALFNRLRSQTVSTRYLYVDSDSKDFSASGLRWGAFYVYLLNDDEPESNEFMVQDGYIHYGQTVKFVCIETGVALPQLIVRRVEKTSVILDADDPISQLHKCVFQFKDSERKYLCLSQDKITRHAATRTELPNQDLVTDNACWTIINTEKAHYCWAEPLGPVQAAISPAPIAKELKMTGGGDEAFVEMKGENFTNQLEVWFHNVPVKTLFRSSELLICKVPTILNFIQPGKSVNVRVEVQIYIVRYDGIVYDTGLVFIYDPEYNTYSR